MWLRYGQKVGESGDFENIHDDGIHVLQNDIGFAPDMLLALKQRA